MSLIDPKDLVLKNLKMH